MQISIDWLRLHNLVFNSLFLISLSQYSLAGPELLFNGKNFFYRNNGKDVPVDISLGTEITRFQEEHIYPSQRKTRETLQYMDKGLTKNENEKGLGYLYANEGRRNKDTIVLDSEILKNKLGEIMVEEHPSTRSDIMTRNNGKDVPVDLSLGTEITRFQKELNYPSQQKTGERLQLLDKGLAKNFIDGHVLHNYEDRRNKGATDLGTEIVENELGGMVAEEEHCPTRYDIMTSLAFNIAIKNPEDLINDIISMIKEDLEEHFKGKTINFQNFKKC